MGDMSNLNFGDFTTNLRTFQEGLTNVELGAKTSPIRDTTSVSPGLTVTVNGVVYSTSTGRPILPMPGDSTPGGLDSASNMIKNFPDQILAFFDNFPTMTEDTYPDDFDAEIAAVGEETLKKIGGGDAKKGALKVRFAALHPDAPGISKELAAVATSVREKTDAKAGHGPSETLIAVEDAAINALSEWHFQEAVESMGLSDSDKKALYFAHNVPGSATNLSPVLQAALKNAEAAATLKTQDLTGVPKEWLTDPDTAGYEAKLGSEFSAKVIGSLEKQLLDGKITKAQFNEMRTLLFIPDSETPNKATLLPMLKEFTAQVTQGMQKDYGFPTNYSPKPNAAGYNAILNGTFNTEFNRQIENSNLTPEQQAILKAALLSSSAAEALPADLKAIFDKAMAAGIQKVGRMYGVPKTWVPNSKILTAAAENANNPKIISVQIGINQAKEWLDTGKKAVELLAASGKGGPQAILLKEYMKTVSLALQGMQEMLYELSITDANMADIANKVQNDEKLGQLRQQAADLKEVIDKQKKAESLGPLKAIFQWIIMLILVMFLGPVGLMIAMTLMVASLTQVAVSVSKGKEMFKAFMEMNFIDDLGKTLADIGKAIGGPGGEAFARAMTVLVLVMMVLMCPTLLVCDLMIGDSAIIKQTLMAVGVPKKDAEMAAMVLQIVFQVVVMVVMIIVTAGASLVAMMAQIGKFIAEVVKAIVTAIRFIITNFMKGLAAVIQWVCSAVGTTAPTNIGKSVETALKAVEKFLKTFIDTCKATIKNLDEVGKLEKIVKVTEKAVKEASNHVDDLTKAAGPNPSDDATAGINMAKEALDLQKDALNYAKSNLKLAVDSSKAAADTMFANIEKVTTGMEVIKAVTEAVPAIKNNIIQAQIARIRAAMDAAMVMIEQFVKLMKDLVKKLMDMVSAAGSDIKGIGESQQKMFNDASQTIGRIFQG
ncbi:MAG: hypothetical protein H0T62_06070 [Parachlamydiaceae bacterium]|nr:hypothetical protein [Parachlamydiaceae bacterium]